MAEKMESSPVFKLKDIGVFKTVKIKLDGSTHIATGESQYGAWYLWAGEVENQTVYEGRGKDEKAIKNYTGRVIFFPTERVNKSLVEMANGNADVEVSITKTLEESPKGPVRKYIVKKISEGRISSSSLNTNETNLVEDLTDLMKDGYNVTEEEAVSAATEEKYGGTITKERAKELFKLTKDGNA